MPLANVCCAFTATTAKTQVFLLLNVVIAIVINHFEEEFESGTFVTRCVLACSVWLSALAICLEFDWFRCHRLPAVWHVR
jgi:hypothetical protein